MYLEGFENKKDMADNFQIPVSDLDDCNIIFAAYTGGYDAVALIVFEKEGVLYEVNGSHCSCYGLEGQWAPEETCVEALKKRNYSEFDPELQKNLEKFLVDYFFEKEVLLN